MKLKVYLKDHLWAAINLGVIMFIINLMLVSSTVLAESIYEIIYMNILVLSVSLAFLLFRYNIWKWNYQEFNDALNKEEDIDLVLPKGDNFQIKLIKAVIELKNKKTYEEINKLKDELNEINDYITKWIHELKIPISVCELIIDKIEENSEAYSDVSEELRGELARIKFLIEQVLYVGRASSYSEDLMINEVNLEKVVRDVVKKNSFFFISKKIDLRLDNINFNVMTDKKWISYILEQIINNACKYVDEKGLIQIYAEENEEEVKLHIKDNGIGILPKDINRVFDKGFTGENGRKVAKSTGMGLYFSQNMAQKLNHSIQATSEVGKYTEFTIVFYKLSDYFMI